jgi:hypothetical protein
VALSRLHPGERATGGLFRRCQCACLNKGQDKQGANGADKSMSVHEAKADLGIALGEV